MTSVMGSADQSGPVDVHAPSGQLRHFALGDPGFAAFELGLRALPAARDLADSAATQHAALLLYRSATIFFLVACGERRAEPVSLAKPWTAAELEQFPELQAALSGVTVAQVPMIIAALTSEVPERELLSLPHEEQQRCLRGLRELALALAEQLAQSTQSARSRRLARVVKLAAVGLCLLIPLAWALLRPPNLALNRAVVVSSRHREFGVDPRQVVDGKRRNLGFHSEDAGRAVVTVDLGMVRRIRRVDVFNRSDCCQERAVPLELKVSKDGRSFRTLLVRIDSFSLWKAEFPATEARYVRLAQDQAAAFHLAEIEVY